MSKFQQRFGTLKAVNVKQSAAGNTYAHFQIETPNFTVYAVAFEDDLVKQIAETEEGERIWAGGFIDTKKVTTENGERSYSNLVVRKLKIGGSNASESDASDDVAEDDLTQLKGIGTAAAQKLKALGYLTFAQLAKATSEERAVLDDEVPAVSGALSRHDVFGQAEKLAA